MKTAKLEVLDLKVPLKESWEYHNHGYVKNLPKWFSETFKDYDIYDKSFVCIMLNFGSGATFVLRKGKPPFIEKRELHIAYKDTKDKLVNLLIAGHEETHALSFLDNLKLLEEAVKEEYNLPFKLTGDRELIAEIGGIYGVLKKGFSLEDLKKISPSLVSSYLNQAIKLYEESNKL